MKKRLVSFLLVVCTVIFGTFSLIACENTNVPTPPQKLAAPVVTLTESVAAWEADTNADKFELSLDGNLSYVENTVTSKALTDGQSFKLRAVGDGVNYSTSDWSNSVTYTASSPSPQPIKLSTPTVTVSSEGLASWSAVANASGYAYKINGGTETPTTATSVQLLNGQNIVVKAVGDGTNYTDGDYSAPQTFTASTPTPTGAPTYLGILASNEEPTANEKPSGLPQKTYAARASFDEILKAYLSDANNSLGDAVPTASSYSVYSTAGNTVYVQIWLNNPDQNTILSLKLNGTKYQSGGALQSFFIQDGTTYLNCVYVAVTVPSGSHTEISYEVTEIEYVEGTNINQDGKAVLIDETNDTVVIGLPYAQAVPSVILSNPAATAAALSFDLAVTDEGNLVALTGSWLRAVLYTQNGEIVV